MKHRLLTVLLVCLALLAAHDPGLTQDRERVRRTARPIPNRYVVVLADGVDPQDVIADAELRHGGRRRHLFRRALTGFSMRMTRVGAERLARDPRVRLVEEDGVVSVAQALPWGLDRIDQRARPLDGLYGVQALGTGVVVHVLDTGVRTTHQEFGGRAFIAGDYIDDDGDGNPFDVDNDDADPTRPDGADCHGHGTHVAGTIGGTAYGVAKGVTLRSHRVLGCAGDGSTSDLIAAVDAITASTERPAVANLSLTGDASAALDEAVARSIAAGVTYVVAAGNQNQSAALSSPGRVGEAITVGAVDVADKRASFSNFGPVLDLFAPGVGTVSASHASDTAVVTRSGTSMAAPHVAGVAALWLQQQPTLTPAALAAALVGAATPNEVVNPAGSPNRLLHSNLTHGSAPVVELVRPVDGERVLEGIPYTIEWRASDPDGLERIDLFWSIDSGVTFQPLDGCQGLNADQQSCTWAAPGPLTTKGRLRVVARDLTGDEAGDRSFADFSIVVRPELLVVSVSNPPALAAPGASFGVTDIVRNDGNADAPASLARYYASLDGARSADDVRLTGSRSVPMLVPGAQSQGPASVALPTTLAPGVYTLLACADDAGAVTEADETNNCTAAAATMRVEMPDLVESSLSGMPASAAAGASFTVSGSTHNQGTTAAVASATRFYLSVDSIRGAGDLLMTGSRSVPLLAAGASFSGSTVVQLPANTANGAYIVLACADDTLKVKEAAETNNCLAGGTVLVGKPDLVTTALSNPPAAVAPAATFSVSTTVQNVGAVSAAASTLRFYLSTDDARSSNDLLLSGTRSIGILAAGASSTGNTTLTVPAAAALGTYHLLACADDQLKVVETDEANCRAAAGTVAIARPDLVQQSVANPPASVAPGSSLTLSDTVQNQSTVAVASSATAYYLSADAVRNAGDVLLTGTRSVPALAAGAASTASKSVTVPTTTPLGTYRVIACADDQARIVEASEVNNCAASSTSIAVTWPDLATTALTAPPPSVAQGLTFAITDTVTNQGGHQAPGSTSRYYLSLDAVKGAGDLLLTATRSVGTLAAGQTSTGTRTLTVPATAPPGRYYLLACADDLNQVSELDNVNNCLASTDFAVGP